MPTTMESLEIGAEYIRDTLASLWGYKSRHAISRGIVTPSNDDKIILFVTKIKQKSDTQYHDYFIEECLLHMEGEIAHTNDERIIKAEANNEEIYLFYRDIHHTPFTYYGRVFLVDYKVNSDKPSVFILSTSVSHSVSASTIFTEQNKTSSFDIHFIADEEGVKRNKIHVSYERSIKNRAKAIEIHGTKCKACDFDFDQFYGKDLAKHFIEIHHVIPLSKLKEERTINPLRDLLPLCSNCHSMMHRSRDMAMTVEDLREKIKARRDHSI